MHLDATQCMAFSIFNIAAHGYSFNIKNTHLFRESLKKKKHAKTVYSMNSVSSDTRICVTHFATLILQKLQSNVFTVITM